MVKEIVERQNFDDILKLKASIDERSSMFFLGEKVFVKDGSNNICAFTKDKRDGVDPLFSKPGTIVEKHLFIINEGRCFSEHKIKPYEVCDILLKFEDGSLIYTSSQLIRKQ